MSSRRIFKMADVIQIPNDNSCPVQFNSVFLSNLFPWTLRRPFDFDDEFSGGGIELHLKRDP